jgi:hypothetical protein
MRAPGMVARDRGNNSGALHAIAGVIAVSGVLPIIVRSSRREKSA